MVFGGLQSGSSCKSASIVSEMISCQKCTVCTTMMCGCWWCGWVSDAYLLQAKLLQIGGPPPQLEVGLHGSEKRGSKGLSFPMTACWQKYLAHSGGRKTEESRTTRFQMLDIQKDLWGANQRPWGSLAPHHTTFSLGIL